MRSNQDSFLTKLGKPSPFNQMSDASDAMSTEDSPVKEQQDEHNDDDRHDENKEQVQDEADDDKNMEQVQSEADDDKNKEQVQSEADDDKHSDNNDDDDKVEEEATASEEKAVEPEEKKDDQEEQVEAQDIKDDQEETKPDQEETKPEQVETKPEESSDDRIVESIYDHMITSICIDVACNMHELIKKGEFSMSELREPFSRREVYPELYKDQEDAAIQETLEKYSTHVPNPRKRPHRKVSSSAGNNETLDNNTSMGGASETNTPEKAAAPTMQTRHTINHSDIWGRTPPKEPKQACECQICGRFVSTLRFAPHLDKCMGLSTRPATGNPSRNMA